MVAVQNYTWEQGEDLIIELKYLVNDLAQELRGGYAVRMDIAPVNANVAGAPIYTFNSEDADEETYDEVVFPPDAEGLDNTGVIHIEVPRALTLPGGDVEAVLSSGNTFAYDLFLRNPQNKQKKILQGQITVNKSVTHWA